MNANVERIRERVADGYDSVALFTSQFEDKALADLRTLLRILDQQQAVIDAAARVARDVTQANWYEDAFTYLVDAEALETMRDTLAALGGSEVG